MDEKTDTDNSKEDDPKDCVSKEEFEKLKRWYSEEVKRKDKIIEDLQKENILLVKSSLKISERLADMQKTKTHHQTHTPKDGKTDVSNHSHEQVSKHKKTD
jgi:hypothetical protein